MVGRDNERPLAGNVLQTRGLDVHEVEMGHDAHQMPHHGIEPHADLPKDHP